MGERESGRTQHRLGRDHDQRALRGEQRLGAQQVEVLGRRRGDGHPHVAPGAERQEPLEAGRGVLGALPLVAVREQHHQAGVLAPLDFGRGQEVVDDDLGAVAEVAELRLPGHQGFGRLDRVAVLEADGGVLGEERVADGEDAQLPLGRRQHGRVDPSHPVTEVGQRDQLVGRGVVDQHGMALAEGAAPGVLPGQSHVDTFVEQRPDGQRLGQGPVHLPLGHHLVALGELPFELGVDGEPVGHRCAPAWPACAGPRRRRRSGRTGCRRHRGRATGRCVGASEGSPRTSSSTDCSRLLKSSRAASAPSSVMSPRRTSVSV